eukprot:TRINITY_DN3920_c0_g1_i1.p1 TRINITY_DN3920_c0_g1~~TRINITY_DN3920_c0_g1_i1.p1  ORF type:complete len:686 (-),score=161.99 TRINITY_DN3920_c0_g1_i1:182-2239(-)
MKKKDLFILFVSCLAIFISFQQHGEYDLDLKFKIPIDTSHFRNLKFPEEDERLPKPVITDLDGDNRKEILVVTTDYRVVLYDTEQLSSACEYVTATPFKKAEASLLGKIGVKKGRKPIGLGAGYLFPQNGEAAAHTPSATSSRKQVVVVVTESLVVLCFDHKLKLIWETNIVAVAHPLIDKPVMATVIISPHNLRTGDNGVVVVGYEIILRDSLPDLGHDHTDTEYGPVNLSYENIRVNEEDHFTYYAFDGKTGSLRWKHEPEDFLDPNPDPVSTWEKKLNKTNEQIAIPNESFKAHLLQMTSHLGEVQWVDYKENVLASLPHRWRGIEDTIFVMDHFQRRKNFGVKTDKKAAKKLQNKAKNYDTDVGVPASDVFGSKYSSSSELNNNLLPNANVIVAHNRLGLEVIHLYTGRPLTRFLLVDGDRTSFFADLNHDGVVDHVQATNQEYNENYCYAIGRSGIPPVEVIFNSSICGSGRIFDAFAQVARTVQTTAPLFFSSAKWPSRGESLSVFLINTGKMTCLNTKGRIMWQVDTLADWLPQVQETGFDLFTNQEASQTNEDDAVPTGSLELIHLDFDKKIPAVVATGWAVSLVSESGEILSQKGLNALAIAPPLIADNNNDGYEDIIVVAHDGYYGYVVVAQRNYYFFPLLVLALLATTAALFIKDVANTSALKKTRRSERKWAY